MAHPIGLTNTAVTRVYLRGTSGSNILHPAEGAVEALAGRVDLDGSEILGVVGEVDGTEEAPNSAAWFELHSGSSTPNHPRSMGSPEVGRASTAEEGRLKSLLLQLQTEFGILDRIVYKNKNQHRRCPYFQALLKVRRDVRLLQSAGLGDILHALFSVIDGRKPAQKAYLPSRLKKNYPSGKHNYQERLLGVARLLSQMVEPILKAAIQVSFLLAKSFFRGFSLTVLALLARLRVLVQQILLDVVEVFNKVSSLSQKKHSVKLNQEGIEAFREYYPLNRNACILECVWEEDKFVLLERTGNNNIKNQDEDRGALPLETPIQYQTLELFNEAQSTEDEFNSEKIQEEFLVQDSQPVDIEPPMTSVSEGSLSVTLVPCQKSLDPPIDSRKKKVAFVSVRKPNPSEMNLAGPNKKMKPDSHMSSATKTDDPFLNLLLGGNKTNTLF